MSPVPVGVEITLWSCNLLSLVDNGLLMIGHIGYGSWVVDSSSLNLMLNIWDNSGCLPDWIVNLACCISNPWTGCGRSSCRWASLSSPSWLWALAGGNDSIGKIVSQWNEISGWLIVSRCIKIWLSGSLVKEVAPFSAIWKFSPLSSNTRVSLWSSVGNSLNKFFVSLEFREVHVDGVHASNKCKGSSLLHF